MNLEIIPYAGASPFNFGITEAKVVAKLGLPLFRSNRPFPPGTVELEYPGIAVAFDAQGHLVQMGFDKNFAGKLTLNGIDLFRDEDALDRVLSIDKEPYLWVGFIMLMKIGIRLGGFHEVADEGRTVSIFERGRYDAKIRRFQPFEMKDAGK